MIRITIDVTSDEESTLFETLMAREGELSKLFAKSIDNVLADEEGVAAKPDWMLVHQHEPGDRACALLSNYGVNELVREVTGVIKVKN